MTQKKKLLAVGLGAALIVAAVVGGLMLQKRRGKDATASADDGSGKGKKRRRRDRNPLGAPGANDGDGGVDDDSDDSDGGRRGRGGGRRGRLPWPEKVAAAPLDPSASALPPIEISKEAADRMRQKINKTPPAELSKQTREIASKYARLKISEVRCPPMPCRVDVWARDQAQLNAFLEHLHKQYGGAVAANFGYATGRSGEPTFKGFAMLGTNQSEKAPLAVPQTRQERRAEREQKMRERVPHSESHKGGEGAPAPAPAPAPGGGGEGN